MTSEPTIKLHFERVPRETTSDCGERFCLLSNKQSLLKIIQTCASRRHSKSPEFCVRFKARARKSAAEPTQVLIFSSISFPSCAREYVKYLQQQIWTSSEHTGFENYIKSFSFCIDNVKLEFLTAFSRAMNISLTLFACKAQLHNLFVATLWHETFVSIKQLSRKRGKLPPVYFKIWGINNFARKLSSLQVHNWENCPSSWKTFSIKFKTGPRGWNQARLDRRGGECSSGVRERGSGELRPLGALALSRLSSKRWKGSPQ